jgi:hypothetical protein
MNISEKELYKYTGEQKENERLKRKPGEIKEKKTKREHN